MHRPEHGTADRPWTVLCDFDGTISVDDVTDALLLRFARRGWEALELDWLDGRIGSRDCMAAQIALLDCNADELGDALAGIAVDPGFAGFVAVARAAGTPLLVVSDGLDVAIRTVLGRLGLGDLPVLASRLVGDGHRRWRLEFPHARPTCRSGAATCKCAAADAARASGRSVLLIGDGASDACVAASADRIFARKRLLGHCIAEGLPHEAVPDFRAALPAWRRLLATPSHSADPFRSSGPLTHAQS